MCGVDSTQGATYNLQQMSTGQGYTIFDTNQKTAPGVPTYAFRFAICAPLDPVLAGLPQCINTTDVNGVVRGSVAAVAPSHRLSSVARSPPTGAEPTHSPPHSPIHYHPDPAAHARTLRR